LTIDHAVINKLITIDNVNVNSLYQGIIESKEAKGFLVSFGMKDKSKGFIAFSAETEHLSIGQLI
jgi:hypothetical protein